MASLLSARRLRSPRDRLLALLLVGLGVLQLLAFHRLCVEQVHKAEARKAAAVQRQAEECPVPVAPSLAAPCAREAGLDLGPTSVALR